MRSRLLTLCSIAVATASLIGLASPAQAAEQAPSFSSCMSSTGTGGACGSGVATDSVDDVAISQDGKNAYTVSGGSSDLLATYTRNTTTGALTYSSCFSKNAGVCTYAFAMDDPGSVTVSPDDKNVYVTSFSSNAVSVFNRNTSTGALALSGCISADGSGALCTNGGATLYGAKDVTVSPDGRSAYVTGWNNDALTVFARNTSTGALTYASCFNASGTAGCSSRPGLDFASHVTVSPDSKNVYVAAGALVEFSRNTTTGALTALGCIAPSGTGSGGACTVGGAALASPEGVIVSPDGKNAYVTAANGNAVVTFSRDATTGALTEGPCVSETGTGGACTDGVALDYPYPVSISPDGANVYVGSINSRAVVSFKRNATTGALNEIGCISESGTGGACTDGVALLGVYGLTVSPDGNNLYATARDSGALDTFNRQTEVFRFWSSKFNNAHFFTADPTEANNLRTSDPNWTYEGVSFKVRNSIAGTCPIGTTAVYRFYSAPFADHFYTSSSSEKDQVKTDPNWSYEGVTYCGFATQVAGTIPLSRFWSPTFRKHFYTSNAAETDQLKNHDPNWSYEGTTFYVLP